MGRALRSLPRPYARHVNALLVLASLVSAAPQTFDFRRDEGFHSPVPALQRWLARRPHPPRGLQHFCVVGYRFEDGSTLAWVHWQEGRMLLLWEGSDPEAREDALVRSRRQLSLDTDVVPTEDEVHGSTYLLTKPWVDALLADCARAGFRYTAKARREGR